MKKISIFIIVVLIISAVGMLFLQNDKSDSGMNLWENAIYTKDVTLGKGENVLIIKVIAGDKSVSFTINSDKEIVGDVLKEHNLVEGEEGPYGLYVKAVNGIEADYDKDQSYWSFEKDGESMLRGVDSTKFNDGDRFSLVRTK